MGYYTTFHLHKILNKKTLKEDKTTLNQILGLCKYLDHKGQKNPHKFLHPQPKEILPPSLQTREITQFFHDGCWAKLKWYNHEEDWIKFSKWFPDVIFIIRGEGEESDDIWSMAVCNGWTHTAYAEIIYPQHDLKALSRR